MFAAFFIAFLISVPPAFAQGADDLWAPESNERTASAQMSLPVTLNRDVTVEGEYILLGDVFGGVTDDLAKNRLAPAPALNRSVVLDGAWLNNAARTNGLNFKAQAGDRVFITRNARFVEEKEIADALKESLKKDGFPKEAEIELNRRAPLRFAVPEYEKSPVSFTNAVYDAQTGAVSGKMAIAYDGKERDRAYVTGKAVFYIEVPCAARTLAAGEVLEESDIEMKKIRFEQNTEKPVDIKELTGKQVRRGTRAGQTLTLADVRDFVAVPKGKIIELIYTKAGLSLKMKAKALENGAIGQTIRFQNQQSKNTVEAEIINSETAKITGKK